MNVPAGIREGQTVVLEGQGLHENVNDEPGDCIFVVAAKPHPVFERSGDDLKMHVDITLAEALCGWSKNIRGVSGANVPVANAGLTKPTDVFEVRGGGMTASGSLFVHAKIRFPTEEEIRTLRPMIARVFSYEVPPIRMITPKASRTFTPPANPKQQQEHADAGMECQVQ